MNPSPLRQAHLRRDARFLETAIFPEPSAAGRRTDLGDKRGGKAKREGLKRTRPSFHSDTLSLRRSGLDTPAVQLPERPVKS